MGVTYTVDGNTVSTVRIESVELVDTAENGNVGVSRFTIDDTAGTLATVGHKTITVEEDDCATTLTAKGFVGTRTITRGTHKTLAGRDIQVEMRDLNELLNRRIFHVTGNRPRESIGDRLTWILGSSHLSGLVADNGFVDYPSTMMDKNDYRTMKPGDVLADCATRLNYNYFVYPDPTTGDPSLWFDDSNTSTNYSSSLRISNVLSDIDWTTTFPVSPRATLSRSPDSVYAGVLLSYEGGRVWRHRAATASAFVERDTVGPSSSVKRRARAIDQADKYLQIHRTEEDIIEDTILVTSSKVNLLKAGMRVQVRYSHMAPEGYSSFTWFRVLERRVRHVISPGGIPEAPDEPLYELGLRLSPQEEGCSVQPTFVQYVYQAPNTDSPGPNFTRRFTLDTPSAPGNLIMLAIEQSDLNLGQVVAAPTGWNTALLNFDMANGTDWWCSIFYKRSTGEQSVDINVEAHNSFGPIGVFIEYAGLTNPVLESAATTLRQVGLGYADVPTFSYPSGPAAVLSVCFMRTGPESGDALSVGGTSHNLRTPIDSAIPGTQTGTGAVAVGDWLRNAASGSVTDWQYFFTNDEATVTVGLVFVGENC